MFPGISEIQGIKMTFTFPGNAGDVAFVVNFKVSLNGVKGCWEVICGMW